MAINLQFPPRKSPQGGFATNATTIEAITDDIRILLLTNWGERPVHYRFGANLRSLVFEQGTDIAMKARDLITAALAEWLPFVNIVTLDVFDSTQDRTLLPNGFRIKLKFEVGQVQGSLEQTIKN